MEIVPEYMGYDRTIVVFSPDGRLFQVEYAREAVKRGTTVVGVRTKDCIVLGAFKITSSLSVTESFEKIYQIDDHIGAAAAGLLSDARVLVNQARNRAQMNQITYEEPVDVSTIVKFLSDRVHISTLYAGMRPYGIGVLVGGIDSTGPRLFETDPSGTVLEWKAHVIGRGAATADKILKQKYGEDMKAEQAIKLVVEALMKSEKDATAQNIEVAVIEGKHEKAAFRRLSAQELKKYA